MSKRRKHGGDSKARRSHKREAAETALSSQARFGNQNATKHGGEAVIKRLASGEPFTGVARAKELAVHEEITRGGGWMAIIEDRTKKLQAGADTWLDAVASAADSGDWALLDKRLARWGWLQISALRVELQIAALKRDGSNSIDYEQILEQRQEAKDEAAN